MKSVFLFVSRTVQEKACIQDARALYILMDPSVGGDMKSLLSEYGRFSEKVAQFYAACIRTNLGSVF